MLCLLCEPQKNIVSGQDDARLAGEVDGRLERAAMQTKFVERHGRLAELDRSFDIEFWQSQPAQARFDAAWELIVHANKIKGGDVRQLRLQRSVEAFQRQPG